MCVGLASPWVHHLVKAARSPSQALGGTRPTRAGASEPGHYLLLLLPGPESPTPPCSPPLVMGQHRHGWLRYYLGSKGAGDALAALKASGFALSEALMLRKGGAKGGGAVGSRRASQARQIWVIKLDHRARSGGKWGRQGGDTC
jgi:hypothetical protein